MGDEPAAGRLRCLVGGWHPGPELSVPLASVALERPSRTLSSAHSDASTSDRREMRPADLLPRLVDGTPVTGTVLHNLTRTATLRGGPGVSDARACGLRYGRGITLEVGLVSRGTGGSR